MPALLGTAVDIGYRVQGALWQGVDMRMMRDSRGYEMGKKRKREKMQMRKPAGG